MVERRAGASWLVSGGALLAVLFAGLVIGTAGFACGQTLSAWQGVVAVLAAFGWSKVAASVLGAQRAAVTGRIVVVAVLAAGAALSARIYDLGFDSQSYHQLAITELANGWNPLREPSSARGAYALFAAHYSTGTWIQAALAFLVARDLEAAKVVNVVALAASFCLCMGALSHTGIARGWRAVLVATAAAFNPVTVVQLATFYVDGYLASMLVSLAAVLLLTVARPRPLFLAMSAMIVVLGANAKFTGVVYPLPFVAAAAVLLLRRAHSWRAVRRFVTAHALAYGVATAAVGFHPYVTNALGHGHPFYPLRGASAVHDVAPLRPAALRHEECRFERLVRSVFADPASPWRTSERVYKVPFAVSRAELSLYGTPDARLGGWGPLFGGALVLSLGAAAALALGRAPRDPVALGLVLGAILVSVLTNSECWWARLAPQLALVPVAIALLARAGGRRRWGAMTLGASLANATLVVAAQVSMTPRQSAALARALEELARTRSTVYVSDRWIAPLRRLHERGIPFIAIRDDGPDPDPDLGKLVPCAPLRRFPGTMDEIGFCSTHGDLVASAP